MPLMPRASPVLHQPLCLAPLRLVALWVCLPLTCAAQTASDVCTANPADATPPYTLWLDQTVGVHDMLGSGWMPLDPIHWTCSRSSDAHTTLAVQPVVTVSGSGIAAGDTIAHEGETYRRFTLQQGGQTVGYVARWRSVIAGHSSDWRPVTQAVAHDDASAAALAVAAAGSATYRAVIEVQMRLIKTHAASPAPNTSVHFAPVSATLRTQRKQGGTLVDEDAHPAQAPAVTAHFKHVMQACVTPDVHVQLPPVVLTPDTAAVWSAGPATAFAVELKNCPANLNGIDYKFQSIPHQPIVNGVLPLMATSTAAGVGIQVLKANNSPLAFDLWHTLTNYDPALDAASYTIPLAARVIRTPGQLRAGSVHAAMNVTLEYK